MIITFYSLNILVSTLKFASTLLVSFCILCFDFLFLPSTTMSSTRSITLPSYVQKHQDHFSNIILSWSMIFLFPFKDRFLLNMLGFIIMDTYSELFVETKKTQWLWKYLNIIFFIFPLFFQVFICLIKKPHISKVMLISDSVSEFS